MFVKAPLLLPRLFSALVLVCVGIVLAQVPAQAVCRCVQQSDVQTDIKRADAVFSGVVVESSGTARGSKSDFATYEIEADTVYKGNVRTSTVDVRSKNDDCSLGELRSDKPYVFFVTEQSSELRADQCGGTAASSGKLVRQVEQVLGAGSTLGGTNKPDEPVEVEFTKVSDADPDSLTRIAAPGAALVLVGLLGLLVVRRVRD
ncbi:MAG: hypothetical protein ACJ72P_09725 [Nocardioides sp.]